MSGISSGVGLISGLPTADLIDSLMAIQARPQTILKNRVTTMQRQQSAMVELNARLLGLQTAVARLGEASLFQQFSTTSSDDSVLTASAGSDALPGSISLLVRSLVTSHQLVSRGFADADTTPVGAGQLTIEIGRGRLNPTTMLGDLNGGAGVRRGRIEIVDGAGGKATVDLTAAVSVDDVLRAINTAAEINVQARVSGGRLVLEDRSAGTGTMTVTDVAGGQTANELGIAGRATEGEIEGREVMYVADNTLLSRLNDGNGVRHNPQGQDFRVTSSDGSAFTVSLVGQLTDATRLEALNSGNGVRLGQIRITNRAGASGTVDLSTARTIGDVRQAINAATDAEGDSLEIDVSMVAVGGVGNLVLTDGSEAATDGELQIEDVSGFAARDLGIAQSTTGSSMQGRGVYRINTIGDVVRAINLAEGNDGYITASVTSAGLQLRDNTLGTGSLMVEALSAPDGGLSQAASDLGIEGTYSTGLATSRRLLAGLNTVLLSSLNGGGGVELGRIALTARDGTRTEVDLSGAETIQDVLDLINAVSAESGVSAELNSAGNGLALVDTTGGASANLTVEDVDGTAAADLGIEGAVTATRFNGANLQLQYVSEVTELGGLNSGRGVSTGEIEFKNTLGAVFTVTLTSSQKTMGDVINLINADGAARGIQASLNATGDGLLITDSNGGSGRLRITDVDGGQSAADLRIAGESAADTPEIDGSYEIRIEVGGDDTLSALAERINAASSDLSAAVINDGSSATSYRLSITSAVTGRRGEMIFDDSGIGLGVNTLVAAQDAVVLVGQPDGGNAIVVSSSSNTVSGVLPGVDLDLHGTSADPVTLSVGQDLQGAIDQVETFVTNYNAVLDRIDTLTSFNVDTNERGVLLGDSAVSLVESRLSRTAMRRFEVAPEGARRMADVGISVESGGRLSFDAEVFSAKYAEDPEGVETLFTTDETGLGDYWNATLDELTDADTGIVSRREDMLGEQVDDLNDRITAMGTQLAQRRAQLERQFASLETVLAGLQAQQSALTQLSKLASQK